MAGDSLQANSLALALCGFSVDAESEMSEGRPCALAGAAPVLAAAGGQAATGCQGPARVVAPGTAALVAHASTIAGRVLQSWQKRGYDPEPDGEQLASLCFALQSTVGTRGRLSEGDEQALFDLASALWVSDALCCTPFTLVWAAMAMILAPVPC